MAGRNGARVAAVYRHSGSRINWQFGSASLRILLVEAWEIPDMNPMDPKYRALIELWQRLHLPVSQLLGPTLAKNIS